MRTRVLALAGAAAMAGGLLTLGSSAYATHKSSPTNVSGDKVTCNSIVGTIKFNPPLVSGGDTTDNIAIKEVSSGCTDTTNGAVLLTNATFSGTITNPGSNDCAGLLGPGSSTGTITGKWKTATGAPKITPAETAFTVNGTNGTTYSSDTWGASYGEFQIGTTFGTGQPSITGANNAFAGGNSGHTSTFDGTTGQDVGGLLSACLSSTGIKEINFGIGGQTLQ